MGFVARTKWKGGSLKLPDPVIKGRIIDGKFDWTSHGKYLWERFIRTMEGREIEIEAREARRTRSNPQNRWYWAVIIPKLADHLGYDRDEMHDALKMRFLAAHEDSPLPTVKSTTRLTTTEFTEYAEQCRRLAAEMGVYIPDPGEIE